MIGREARAQLLEAEGRLPDAVIACVGGGSNAIGMFAGFLDDADVALVGVEAAGAASLGTGRAGVLHGARSSMLADEDGQIADAHSISAGPRLPGRRPRARVPARQRPRASTSAATDDEALAAFRRLARTEGIIPALEPAHALARVAELDAELILVCLSGRGDKDLAEVLSHAEAALSKPLVIYLMAGPETPELAEAAVDGGADLVEIGFPFSDPLADGPVIRRAAEQALAQGMRTQACLECLADVARARRRAARADDVRLAARGLRLRALRRRRARRPGATSLIVADLPARSEPELRRVQLVAPTSTDERIRLAAERTDGWLYLVTRDRHDRRARRPLARARRPRRARAAVARRAALRRLRDLDARARAGRGRARRRRRRRLARARGGRGRPARAARLRPLAARRARFRLRAGRMRSGQGSGHRRCARLGDAGTQFRGFRLRQNFVNFSSVNVVPPCTTQRRVKGNIMRNSEQAPSKRVRIVLCAAALTVAAVVPGAGLAADWSSGKAKPTADWTSGKTNPAADWSSGKTKPAADWTSKVKRNADWSSARIKPAADWSSRVKPNADWSS